MRRPRGGFFVQGGKGSGKGLAPNSRKSPGIAAVQTTMGARVNRVRSRIGRVALAEGEHPQYQRRLHLPKSKHETVGGRRGSLLAYRDIELHAICQSRSSRAVLFARLPRHGRRVGLNLLAGLLGLDACGRVFPQTANLLGPDLVVYLDADINRISSPRHALHFSRSAR